VALKFAGQAELTEIDDANHSAVIKAKGADNKGRGQAQATVVFQLTSAGDNTTRVDVKTDLNLTGTVAQYGRASGLIDEIANQLISQFVSNLEVVLQEDQPGAAASGGGGGGGEPSAPKPAPAAKPVSGISLLLRAMGAMIKRWFGGK